MASPAAPIYQSSHEQFAAEILEFFNEGQPKDQAIPADPATVAAAVENGIPQAPAQTPAAPAPAAPAAPAPTPVAAPAAPATPAAPALPEIPQDLDEISFEEPADAPADGETKPAAAADGETKPAAAATDPAAPTPPATPAPADINAALQAAGITFTLEQLKDPDFTEAQMATLLSTNRGRAMYANWKEFRDLQTPPDPTDPTKGGLGFIPKPDEIRSWRDAHLALQAFQSDFESSPADLLLNLFGPIQVDDPETGGRKQILTQTSRQVVAQIPQVFRQHAPGHYQALAESFITDHVRWMNHPNLLNKYTTEEQADIKFASQLLQQLFLKDKSIPGLAPAAAPPSDPAQRAEWDRINAEKERLAQERQRNETARRTAENNRQVEVQNQIINTVQTRVMTGIRNAVAPIAKYHAAIGEPKATTDALISRIAEQVVDYVQGNRDTGIAPLDPKTLQEYDRAIKLAARRGEGQSQVPVRIYQRLAEMAMRKVIPPILREYANRATTSNAAVHQRATVAAAQVAPVAAAAPVPATVVAPPANFLQRGEGESMQDFYKRTIQQQLNGGGAR